MWYTVSCIFCYVFCTLGKSTTMGMLCGTLDATFGDAIINGYSISTRRTMARRNLGICMQQDILWDDVNVEDHLLLFGGLRGLRGKELREDVNRMIESLGFPEKRFSMAGQLSGGQKRRLCVGLSMVGGNSVVFLDEPTAGLDPVSRRQLWELVQCNRAGRAILLTTHFMDEADVLGDRIAIVKEGRLRALGTASFLKQRFGMGYLIRMSLVEGNKNSQQILEHVQSFISEASIVSSAGTELTIRMSKASISQFPGLFESIESGVSRNLGIVSFGIETTTLEEVFMRIVHEDTESLILDHSESNKLLGAGHEERDKFQKKINVRDNYRNPITENQILDLLVQGRLPGASQYAVFLPQVLVLLRKRVYQFTRSKGQWSMGCIVPILVAILIAILISIMPTEILANQSSNINIDYVPMYAIPITGQIENQTNNWANQAFSSTNLNYIGASYTELFDFISMPDQISSNAISYTAISNVTVLYNASYPQNFIGSVTNVLNAAVLNSTKNLLTITVHANQLPTNLLGQQANDALIVGLLFSLFAGSIGAALSIVISGERVLHVKHQQLASGASKLAYWTANFLFDFSLFFIQIVILIAILSAFVGEYSAGSNYGTLIGLSIPYIIPTIFRFYALSFIVEDIRMAQTVFFYGSLCVMFLVVVMLFMIVFTSYNGNIGNPSANTVTAYLTVLEPTLAYFLFVMFTNNFLAVKTLNSNNESVASIGFSSLFFLVIVCIPVYLFVLCYCDGMLNFRWFRKLFLLPPSNSNSKSGITAPFNAPVAVTFDDVFVVDSNIQVQEHVAGDLPKTRCIGAKDPDIIDETARVQAIYESRSIHPEKCSIFIHDLKKVYFGRGTVPTKVAVNKVNVSIPRGEVFGLLGANGAGKVCG